MIEQGSIKCVFILENSEIPDEVQALIDDKKVSAETYRNLQSIKEEERNNDVTYISLSKANLETLKKELY